MTEEWKPIAGFENAYQVSSQGRVRSLDRTASDGSFRAGRLLRPGRSGASYLRVSLCSAGRQRSRTVHSLVAEAFLPKSAGLEVCHKDGDPSNNNVENLRWGTHQSNMADQRDHGTNARSQRTSCPEGHSLVAPNLRSSEMRRGHRSCRACQLGRRRAAKRGETFSRGDADDIYARLVGHLAKHPAPRGVFK